MGERSWTPLEHVLANVVAGGQWSAVRAEPNRAMSVEKADFVVVKREYYLPKCPWATECTPEELVKQLPWRLFIPKNFILVYALNAIKVSGHVAVVTFDPSQSCGVLPLKIWDT